jgi:hypothetical protein
MAGFHLQGLSQLCLHTLDDLLAREDPVLVPAAVTVMAQAVGVQPSRCEVRAGKMADGCEDGCDDGGTSCLDFSALDKDW